MNRYLVFFGSVYYPNGGMNDFVGHCDTIELSLNRISLCSKYESVDSICDDWEWCWAHVYDTMDNKIVWSRGFNTGD